MPRPRINYSKLKDYILVYYYDNYISDGAMEISLAALRNGIKIPKNVLKACIEDLEGDLLIIEGVREVEKPDSSIWGAQSGRMLRTRQYTGLYSLTTRGREKVESMTDDAYDLTLANLRQYGVGDAFTPVGESAASPPLEWSPLPIELSDEELSKVRVALADTIQKIEQENGYAAEHQAERADVLARFGALDRLLTHAGQLTYSHFVAYVSFPLETLSKRFPAESILGGVIVLLKDAISAWIKKKIGTSLDDLTNS